MHQQLWKVPRGKRSTKCVGIVYQMAAVAVLTVALASCNWSLQLAHGNPVMLGEFTIADSV